MVLSTIILIFNMIAFASVHSYMASLKFKRLFTRAFGSWSNMSYIFVYSLIAIFLISPLAYILNKNPGRLLYKIPSPLSWLMVCGQAIVSLASPKALFDGSHRFKILSQLDGPNAPGAVPLNIRGIYRYVRDPFTASALVMMLLTPVMTVNKLCIYILTAVYLFLGSLHWESRLIAQFGDEYREYQKRVNRLIPRFRSSYKDNE